MRVNTVPTKLFWWLLFFRAFLFSFPNIVSRVLVGFYKVLICSPLKYNIMLDNTGWQGKKKTTDETTSSHYLHRVW